MFGITMPWTRLREAREAAEEAQRRQREQAREARRAQLRATWLSQPKQQPAVPADTLGWAEQPSWPASAAPAAVHGHGGTFDGGGASGDWSTPASCDSSSSSSSSDSGGGGDCGGGGGGD